MRNVHKAQPAGFQAFKETEHMDAAGEPANVHKLEVADDPPDSDALPPWLKGNELFALKAQTPGLLICGPDGGEDGAILRQRRKLVIGGSSKMGKTWTLLDLALAVASGGYWLGKFKCEQGAVLYVNLELDGSTAARRAEWIATFRGIAEDDRLPAEVHERFLTWNLRGKCYDLTIMLSAARKRLAEVPGGLRLIVLDPIYKTYGGRDECGAAIAFAAHFSKGNQAGKEAIDRISGSGVMARDPDAIVTFTPHEEENCFVLEASLREFAPIPSTVFEWAAPVLNPRDELDPGKLRQAGKMAITKAPQRAEAVRVALEANGGHLPGRSALTAAIKQSGSFPDNAAIAAWKKCLKDHPQALADVGVEIVKIGDGKDTLWRLKTADRKPSNDPF
jgi:hypothetical protein